MTHIPRFWKEKGFVGWPKFLEKLANEQPNKILNSTELAHFYCPLGEQERDKILANIANALSNLKNRGALKAERRGFYKLNVTDPGVMPEHSMEFNPEIVSPKLNFPGVSPKLNFPGVVSVKEAVEMLNPKVSKLSKAIIYALENEIEIPLKWVEQYNELIS